MRRTLGMNGIYSGRLNESNLSFFRLLNRVGSHISRIGDNPHKADLYNAETMPADDTDVALAAHNAALTSKSRGTRGADGGRADPRLRETQLRDALFWGAWRVDNDVEGGRVARKLREYTLALPTYDKDI